jgi:hypothetical protein
MAISGPKLIQGIALALTVNQKLIDLVTKANLQLPTVDQMQEVYSSDEQESLNNWALEIDLEGDTREALVALASLASGLILTQASFMGVTPDEWLANISDVMKYMNGLG